MLEFVGMSIYKEKCEERGEGEKGASGKVEPSFQVSPPLKCELSAYRFR